MKTILLSTYLLVLTFNVFAQTKVETIQWLAEKIQNYGQYQSLCSKANGYTYHQKEASIFFANILPDSSILSINSCSNIDRSSGDCAEYTTYSVHLSDITSIQTVIGCDDKKYLLIYALKTYKQPFALVLDFDAEADLFSRVTKAFNYYISLNHKKEAF